MFPTVSPVLRTEVEFLTNLNPFWVAGFVSGDGGFFITISKLDIKYYFVQIMSRMF